MNKTSLIEFLTWANYFFAVIVLISGIIFLVDLIFLKRKIVRYVGNTLFGPRLTRKYPSLDLFVYFIFTAPYYLNKLLLLFLYQFNYDG